MPSKRIQPPKKIQAAAARPQGSLFDEVIEAGVEYLRTGQTTILKARLRPKALSIFAPLTATAATENLCAIQHVVSFLTDIASGEREVERVKDVAECFATAVQDKFDIALSGFGGSPIGFDTISKIKRAYWRARGAKFSHHTHSNPTHEVIRINDIPFAESVYPALLSRRSNDFGKTIIVEDVQWSDIGAALLNQKLDVALYNGSLRAQLKGVETLFARRLIYRSAPLIRYVGYEIIRRTHSEPSDFKLAVPWKSDFDEVVRQHIRKRGGLKLRSRQVQVDDIAYLNSADQVLEHVVDGKIKYGIVGGLQSLYAQKQFVNVPSPGTKFGITVQSSLDNLDIPEANCYFWVAVERRDEAKRLLSAMTTLWNELAVREWEKVVNDPSHTIQNDLVEIVNLHPHRAFVDDFQMLHELITRHDRRIGEVVPYRCELVELPT